MLEGLSWRHWCSLALGLVAPSLACAVPCVDDGFLGMQHDAACKASSTDATTTTTTTSGATTSAGPTSSATSAGTMSETTSTDSSTSTSTTSGGSTTESSADGSSTGAAICGDAVVDPGEGCDDGNHVDDDACTNACSLPACGDGVVQAGEQCDDANAVEVDDCNFACKPTPMALVALSLDVTETAIQGGPNGSDFAQACAESAVLIGLVGHLDDQGRIGTIQGVCTPLELGDDGQKFVPMHGMESPLLMQGMNQLGGPWTAMCPGASAVVGFRGRKSMWIDQLVVRCASIAVDVSPQGDYSVGLGVAEELAVVGTAMGGAIFGAEDCPMGQVAVKKIGRAGDVIDALGLGCAKLALEP